MKGQISGISQQFDSKNGCYTKVFPNRGVQMLTICNGKGITDFIVDKAKKKP